MVVWMDGIMLKVKHSGKYINKCIYLVIGLKQDGLKEVLGMWMAESESASFWLSVLTDLKARGVEDILIACTDNLKGFTEAIEGVFPQRTLLSFALCIKSETLVSTWYGRIVNNSVLI
jgi:putative transposase